jgi:uncharacterized protein DUF2490
MRRLVILVISLIALFGCVANSRAQSTVPESDTQSWTDVQVTVPLNKRAEFVIIGTLRIGDNITDIVDQRHGVRFNYLIQKYVTLQTSYFHRDARPPNGRQEHEERVTWGANFRVPLGKFTLNTRNWFERRWRQPQVDAWRYRNRIQLEHPFKIGKTKFNWIINDEFFYDWSLRDWVRNRFSAGISHAFNKHLTLDIYAMRQNDGRSRPGDINIIGTTWRVRL